MGYTRKRERFEFGVRWPKALIVPLPNGDHIVFYQEDEASESAVLSPAQSSAEWRLLRSARSAPVGSAARSTELTPKSHPGPEPLRSLRLKNP